jgi:serine/threonine protein kinase
LPKFTYTLNIAMELCRGPSLHEWIQKQHRIDHHLNISILYQLLLGLRHVHSQGIIHRDIKPANIILDSWGNHPSVKIGDFGLATLTLADGRGSTGSSPSAERVQSLGSDGGEHTAEVGTASYCAPEQLAGNVYDHRVDIYAVGIIVVELFVPFHTAMVRCAP